MEFWRNATLFLFVRSCYADFESGILSIQEVHVVYTRIKYIEEFYLHKISGLVYGQGSLELSLKPPYMHQQYPLQHYLATHGSCILIAA